jgi:hypothetical protein
VTVNSAGHVVHVPERSDLRKDVPVAYLRLGVAKALKSQLTTAEQWRALAVLTGIEGSDYFRSAMIHEGLVFGGDELDQAVHDAVPWLLGYREVTEPDGTHVYLDNVAVLESHLNLEVWLAQHDPTLHRHLYVSPDDQGALTLDELLAVMDRSSANLERLQAVWDRAHPLLPTGPSSGSTNEYDDLVRAWSDLLAGLPKIDGWTITRPLPDMNAIGLAYLDYLEDGEPPIPVLEAKEVPEKDLAEYRYRLSRARRRAIRDRLQDLIMKVDTFLPQILAGVACNDHDRLDDARIPEVAACISEIERLMGDTAARRGRWGDLHRHMHFGQGHDWYDIYEFDWPSVKLDIEAASFSETDPLPVPDVDLGQAAARRPAGAASTALAWARLTPEDFERLLYDLLRNLPGHQNVQLLMKTNAADRGRDISAERVIQDGAGSVRTERVMVQAKHWLSKSVPPEEIGSAITRITLWEPPVVRGLIVATSGHFTPDAVAWAEKHNEAGKVPLIDLWPESRLETLLSERPWLVASHGLR